MQVLNTAKTLDEIIFPLDAVYAKKNVFNALKLSGNSKDHHENEEQWKHLFFSWITRVQKRIQTKNSQKGILLHTRKTKKLPHTKAGAENQL
ncbi:hypothetical protein COT72_03090 [archaeon CG10_big_fil_rev_8_21_14_0_10_43_11]|nr:MAG: hypothetical protein COT72_03090 [archaeon CG10_big_fil_rev_8_21_14_0_10_43_11]